MTTCIAFDLARLFIGPMYPSPRGIDRVDLAYARHFFEQWPGDSVGILPTPWGIRWFDRDRSLRVVAFIESRWGETADAWSDPAYLRVKARLTGGLVPAQLPPDQVPLSNLPPSNQVPPSKGRSAAALLAAGVIAFIRQHGFASGHPVTSLPAGAVYLNTGQITLALPQLLGWLAQRRDVKPVFMLHDAIPIEYPEYCSPRSSRFHGQMLANTARHAAGVIVTTIAAGESIKRELARRHRTGLAMVAAPLPAQPLFSEPAAPDPALRNVPYFVVTGAIDPRKNHLLLLNVWRELVRREGANAPRLVVAGSRFRTSDAVADMLERCEVIRDHVLEIPGLTTPGLRQLLAGARALLMPSYAEGFGIPIVEALALGTPVIASDLAAHQEAGGPDALYLSPDDGPGWLAAIRAAGARAPCAARPRAASAPWTWPDYFQRIDPFISGIGAKPDAFALRRSM
jgi:glycosyltransferase involved in cell wall biosynthesis